MLWAGDRHLRGSGHSLGTEPFTCVIRRCLQGDRIRRDRKNRTSSWCRRERLDAGKTVHPVTRGRCRPHTGQEARQQHTAGGAAWLPTRGGNPCFSLHGWCLLPSVQQSQARKLQCSLNSGRPQHWTCRKASPDQNLASPGGCV